MTAIQWGKIGEKTWETGVDHGVLYPRDSEGDYDGGVPWNGLTQVTESPSGGESSKQYADNGVYANLKSLEWAMFTIEAFTFPKEFAPFDGEAIVNGVHVGQQSRGTFGFSWRSLLGNDTEGQDFGYKLHLAWGCDTAPSEKNHATVNESPELENFSWEVTTIPVEVAGTNPVTGKPFRPTAKLTIPSNEVDADALADLELILYGSVGVDPRLPSPTEVLALFAGGANIEVNLNGANAPTYVAGTHIVTLPAVPGVQWQINGVNKPNGAQPAMVVGQTSVIEPVLADGYVLSALSDDDWVYQY